VERGIARGKPEGWRFFSYCLHFNDWQTIPLEDLIKFMFSIVQNTLQMEDCDYTEFIVDDLKEDHAYILVDFYCLK